MTPDKLILVVSKYYNFRKFCLYELERNGYSVVEADSGDSAATALERMPLGGIDLIIMGSRKLPGIETLVGSILAIEDRAPPIIVHSAYPLNFSELFYDKALGKRVKEHVIKSPDTTELLKAVREVIGPP